jgi:Flp pilus assembly protein TadD
MAAAEAALWALVFFSPIALACAPTWTLWPLVALSGIAVVCGSVGAQQQRRSLQIPVFAAVLALACALCLLQLIPLPRPLLDALSPVAARLRDFALIPLGLNSLRPISLDPPATWRELAKGICYLCIFLAAVLVSRSRSGMGRKLLSALALSGAAVALIGYGHALGDARSLFGFHAYRAAQPPFLTTFGNPNHLASFLTLTSTIALGLAIASSDRHRLALWVVAYLAMGAGVFLSLSRGGICFFLAAQLLFAFLLFRAREAGADRRGWRWLGRGSWVIVAVLAVLSVSAFVALERISEELHTADSLQKLRGSKIELWPMIAGAAGHFSRSGMGRGAFEVAFPRYQTSHAQATFTHAENVLLHLWSEFGMLGAAALVLLALASYARLLRRNESSPVDLAVLSGVAAVALHDLFDFSLELPGCAVAVCVALGVASRAENGQAGPNLKLARLVPAASVLSLVGLLAAGWGAGTLSDADEQLKASLATASTGQEIARAALPVIDRHPADYLLYDAVGTAYSTRPFGDPRSALAFANRALFLRPLDVEAHRVAARALLKLGRRSQGFLEYRLAYEAGDLQAETLDESTSAARGQEELRQITPDTPQPIAEVSARLWSSGRKQEARDLVDGALMALATHPDALELRLQQARHRLEARDFPGALEAAKRAEQGWPRSARPTVVKAEILWGMGQAPEAVAALEASFARHPDDLQLAFALAQRLIQVSSGKRAREVLARVSPLVLTPEVRSRWLMTDGESFEAEGQHARALQSYQSAARLTPTQPGCHYAVARTLEALRRPAEAMEVVRAGMKYEEPAGREWVKGRLAELEQVRLRLELLKEEKLRTAAGQ